MQNTKRTQENNEKAQLENEIIRLNKKIIKFEVLAKKQYRYGLVWCDVPEAFEDDVENKLPILEGVPKLSINSKDDNPAHLLIEGDNYHALTCLNYTHKGKIDVIYIDPPYNTGSDGFKYKDKRILKEYPDGTPVPFEHPLRHSYWLSFIKKRLELCVELLNEQGVIIVHIDENEVFNLGLLLNEVFGEQNSVGQIIWNKLNPKGDSKDVAVMHEYILCYSKNKQAFLAQENVFTRKKQNALEILNKAKNIFLKLRKTAIPDTIKDVVKPFNFSENKLKFLKVKYDLATVNFEFRNWLKNQNFSGGEKAYKYIDQNGRVFRPVSMAWPNKEEAPKNYFTPLIHPITKKKCPIPARGWRNSPETMKKLLKDELILFGKDEKTQPTRKYYLDENLIENTPSILEYGGSDDDLLKNLNINFSYVKPVNVAKYLISSVHPNPKIILDFFAGSGTTGQAVMELNLRDKMKKQFILITNNDEVTNGKKHKIMTDICYPRIKNIAITTHNSVRYFKTAFVGKNNILKADDTDKIELAHNAGGMLAIAENTFDQVEQNDYWQIFGNPKQYTAVYFREEFGKFDDFIEKVRKLKKIVVVYIFSWEKEFEFNDFKDDKNIKVKTIPQPILEIYKQIYNLI